VASTPAEASSDGQPILLASTVPNLTAVYGQVAIRCASATSAACGTIGTTTPAPAVTSADQLLVVRPVDGSGTPVPSTRARKTPPPAETIGWTRAPARKP